MNIGNLTQFLKNSDGTYSSRRLAGISLIGLGVTGKIILFHVGLFRDIQNIVELNDICRETLFSGAGLLGLTCFDFLKK